MKFGICCSPDSLPAPDAARPLSALEPLLQLLMDSRADYLEFGVGTVMVEQRQFDDLKEALAVYPLKVEAFNLFIPARHPITGPNVNLRALLEYCRQALRRCRAVGGEVVVLGSGGARRVPQGFNPQVAKQQFVEFCRELGPIAYEAGMMIAIEPLNKKEDNLINGVDAGAKIVDEVAHPHIQLLADLYHMVEDGEPIEHVGDAGSRLRHTHVADLGRVAPGFAPEGEADFAGFFSNLRQAGYDARCSFEGKLGDITAEVGPLVQLLRQRWNESSLQ